MAEEGRKAIVYFEDELWARTAAEKDLEGEFCDCNIVLNMGGKNCVDEVIEASGGVEKIAVVCTDGGLCGGINGWDVLRELKNRGYGGPAIYTGESDLPKSERALYFAVGVEKRGRDLVDAVRKCLSGE